jgi:nitrate reductase (cytochrome), electron transfer subunit
MKRRGIQIGLVVAIGVATLGLIAGVESSGREVPSHASYPAPSGQPAEARSYRDMQTRSYGPNAELPPRWWKQLATRAPVPHDDAKRAARRAYQGAPPTIPHAVDQLAPPACLACHQTGVTIGAVSAPVMNHPRRDSCLQCHVVSSDPRLPTRPARSPEAQP